VPARDQTTTAAVAAGPGQDHHRRGMEQTDRQLGQVPARVLHHLDQLEVQVLDHDAVDVTHLRGGQRRPPRARL
jgi:hypothetical protein